MRMTEVLVCILMFVLISVGLMESYISANRNKDRIISRLNDSDFIITTDYKIRKEVWNISIPYWRNIEAEFENMKNELFTSISTDKVYIKNIQLVGEQSGFHRVRIVWVYKNTEYETIEPLTTKQLAK